MCRKICCPGLLLIVALMTLHARPAFGQDSRWVGRKFMKKNGAKFMIGSREVSHSRINLPFTVRKVQGDWLWVGRAWIDKSHVVPLDDAAAYYTDYLRNNPGSSWAYSNRGIVWLTKQEYDNALKDYTEAIRLDPKYVSAYNNRGTVWLTKQEYDNALKDCTEAIRLDPKYVSAYINRGKVRRAKKEYDNALKDFTEAIRLDPKYAWAHLHRAVVRLLLRQRESLAGFQAVITIQGWNGELAAYSVIVGSLSARMLGDDKRERQFLTDSAGKLNQQWPYPNVRFLRGEIDEATLLKLATDNDKRTEARCYLGLDHLLRGRRDKALSHLRWVKEHGNTIFIEYDIAVAELDRLEKGSKAGKP